MQRGEGILLARNVHDESPFIIAIEENVLKLAHAGDSCSSRTAPNSTQASKNTPQSIRMKGWVKAQKV